MRKVVLSIFWIASVTGAGYIGYQFGQQQTEQPEIVQIEQPPVVVKTAQQPERDPLKDLIESERYFAAIDLVLNRLALNPNDHTLRITLADLYEKTHQFDAAISELLTIRSLSLDEALIGYARRQIDQIVRGAHERFEVRRSTEEAISFFERQTVQEPSYDLHRYFLAKWLLKSRDTDTAERIIRELGLAGITSMERDAIRAELAQSTSTLPIRRQGNSIYADIEVATPAGKTTLTMLVDTGASLTAISHYQLREMGAVRTPHKVRAQTANGTVEVPVYELLSITGGPLTLEYFLVGSLNELPDHVDGLLGLDFLDQLPVPIVNAP